MIDLIVNAGCILLSIILPVYARRRYRLVDRKVEFCLGMSILFFSLWLIGVYFNIGLVDFDNSFTPRKPGAELHYFKIFSVLLMIISIFLMLVNQAASSKKLNSEETDDMTK
ncbi:MAG: hypothetical protein ACFB20_04290 [Opitutales bacterium]